MILYFCFGMFFIFLSIVVSFLGKGFVNLITTILFFLMGIALIMAGGA